jgi:hypothetical protein
MAGTGAEQAADEHALPARLSGYGRLARPVSSVSGSNKATKPTNTFSRPSASALNNPIDISSNEDEDKEWEFRQHTRIVSDDVIDLRHSNTPKVAVVIESPKKKAKDKLARGFGSPGRK